MKCLSCGKEFGTDLSITDYEGYSLDCPHCKFPMVIQNGNLIDFNEFLHEQYNFAGLKINKEIDCTKNFIES
jgi:DNA-directed RNA polymerase subunit RPC12/RpoP